MDADIGLLFSVPCRRRVKVRSAQAAAVSRPAHAQTLYGLGDTMRGWAQAALSIAKEPRLVVVGCSGGGSCALEVAAQAPDRFAALMRIRPAPGYSRPSGWPAAPRSA